MAYSCPSVQSHYSPRLKRGHLAPSPLGQLPVEILEQICNYLVDLNTATPVEGMSNLRLTCRDVHDRAFDFFARNGFRRLQVDLNCVGLCRLNAIANHPVFSAKVQEALLAKSTRALKEWHARKTILKEYKQSTRLKRFAQGHASLAEDRLDINDEQDKWPCAADFGIDTTLFIQALRKLANLRKIVLLSRNGRLGDVVSVSDEAAGFGESMTHLFIFVRRGIRLSKVKLEEFCIVDRGLNQFGEGLDTLYLSMPPEPSAWTTQLKRLDLLIDSSAFYTRTARRPDRSLASLLSQCPVLENLSIKFRAQWKREAYLEQTFAAIVEQVKLPRLRDLTLYGLAANGADLLAFLQAHGFLQKLDFKGRNITDHETFLKVLAALAEAPSSLRPLDARGKGQDGESLESARRGSPEWANGDGWCSDEWTVSDLGNVVRVAKVWKIWFVAEEIDGLGQKLRKLSCEL